uniref:Cytochrome f n=1 Tax=Gracilaria vermiculophylla TaxID=2608709 RepID=A0A345U906_9FLOR|nr:apocytochrome f [Gracilaria vermiculophylla]AXI96942.1 apocytochrome f [Gracilaria vermiculophylla]QXU75147.1 apocytochrome f [Gracilaria vermiculophylla]WDZ67922.1 apocytochrome f [Gracilaria vermiculophylla]
MNIRFILLVLISVINLIAIQPIKTPAFPIYAQQGYENPREATGRIVCANCHLAQKPVEIETPKTILPNSIFEAIVKIPYDKDSKQLLGNGVKGSMNTGAVIILPEGFKLAPKNLLSEELKEKTKNVYIQPYSTTKDNILLVGPLPGDKNQEIIFPILSPDPSKDKNVHFLKYPIYIGANRGRGQVYPTGDKSNNNPIISSNNGKVKNIVSLEKGGYKVDFEKENGEIYIENIPPGLKLAISEGSKVSANQNLTDDPNVGGFGQTETEIVLQSPSRIKGMIIFFFTVTIAQIFFVLKKKQWEKVQAAEINF